MKTVYIITQGHHFGVIEGLTHLIKEGLSMNFAVVTIINIHNQNDHIKFNQLINIHSQPDLVIFTHINLCSLIINGQYITKLIKCRLAVLFMDSPILLYKQTTELLPRLCEDSILILFDAKHKNSLRKYCDKYYSGKFDILFLPYGGPLLKYDKAAPTEEKNIDLTIFCTLDEQITGKHDLAKSWDFALPTFSDSHFAHSIKYLTDLSNFLYTGNYDIDIFELIERHFGIEFLLSNVELADCAASFDAHIKRFRRLALVKELLSSEYIASLKLKICGTGWDNIEKFHGSGLKINNVQFEGPKMYKDQFELFRKSKMVLNIDPNWTSGCHDRVFNTMMSGSVALTNTNLYCDFAFENRIDSLIYNTPKHTINLIQENYNRLNAISAKGYEKASKQHSWGNRMESLLNHI